MKGKKTLPTGYDQNADPAAVFVCLSMQNCAHFWQHFQLRETRNCLIFTALSLPAPVYLLRLRRSFHYYNFGKVAALIVLEKFYFRFACFVLFLVFVSNVSNRL